VPKQMRKRSQDLLFCEDGHGDAVAAPAAAAAFASLSTLSASLMCGVGPGMLRKCVPTVPSDDLRLCVIGEEAGELEFDWVL
jgi:hypothetical protein